MPITLFENSYLTLAEVDERLSYFSEDWDSLPDAQRESFLVQAAALIDPSVVWLGAAVSDSQSMAWPRKDLEFFDPVLGLEVKVSEGEVPERVKKAQAYQALHLSKNKDNLEGTRIEYESITVGPVSLKDSDSSESRRVSVKPKVVLDLLRPLGSGPGARVTWWRAN